MTSKRHPRASSSNGPNFAAGCRVFSGTVSDEDPKLNERRRGQYPRRINGYRTV
ncbi:MAG: hypothetical protein IID36_04190 [Planctomycetes bacterium]|nr:hypothetical protein [Planctomycetota bacterium]